MVDEPRQTRGGCTAENCALVTVIGAHGTQIKSLFEQVEGIQSRKADHETRIQSLEMTQKNVVARVDRAESLLAQTTQTLQDLKGEVHGLSVVTTNVSVTANSTYEMLRAHIAHNIETQEANSLRMATTTKRLIQIIGLTGSAAVLLALIHSALSGQSVLSMVLSLISGGAS